MTKIVSNALNGLYYEFNIPMGLVNLVLNVIEANQNHPNVPQVQQNRAPREWYSQPRVGRDPTVEVLQVNFKLPLSVSTLSFQTLRVPCVITAFYRDRHNNWVPLTDDVNNPVQLNLSYSAVSSWYTFTTDIYPIVATAIQIRLKRVFDPQVGNNSYVVGIKEMLIRRNIYNLESSTAAIEQQQDLIGNTVTSYVGAQPASHAIDNDPSTFWKSFPCPDPNGVVALYNDLRDSSGNPQMLDTIYIDPVYDGNILNVYYSNDPTVGTLVLSSVPLPWDATNADWTLGTGLRDTSAPGTSNSSLGFEVAWGPLVNQPVWIGVEWTPDFNAASPPPDNPYLYSVTPIDPTAAAEAGQYWPAIYYDCGAGEITLEFTNGTTTHSFSQALSPALKANTPMQIVVGWGYDPAVVFMSVNSQGSVSLGTTTTTPATTLPALVTMDGTVGYADFRGLMTAMVVKMGSWTQGSTAFIANADIYANPNPVLPDAQGNFPSSSLDNAILAVDWSTQQFPVGGQHESWFENKTWTPVFANYITSKGNLYLPQVITASYVKLEMTNLTAEPYPVFDSGVQVSYDVFPVAVLKTVTGRGWFGEVTSTSDGVLTLGADIITASIGSVNWLNPSTVQNATNANFGQTQAPIQVVLGPGITTNSIPNSAQSNINGMYRSEQSSPWIYSRSMPNATFLAGQQIAAINGQPVSNQTILSNNDPNAAAIGNSFTPVVTSSKSNVLPQQGADWWLFPGANLKMPASVMKLLFGSTKVKTGRGRSLAARVRFAAVGVHRYDVKTVTLDAAVAYFAGLSEVSFYLRTYIAGNDPLSFSYSQYDPNQFTYENIFQELSGPLTTSGSHYQLENDEFLPTLELTGWTPTGDWFHDPTHGPAGINAAGIVADGNPLTLVSAPVSVSPGDQIVISAWVSYFGAVSGSGGELTLSAISYDSGVAVAPITLGMPTTTATHTVLNRAAMLALSGVTIGQSCTITSTADQGTYVLLNTPSTTFSNWVFTGYGTLVNQPTGTINGRLAVQLVGTYTVPGTGVDAIAVSLDVSAAVTAGTMYWGKVEINPSDGIEGTVHLSAQTTSNFTKLDCVFNDSGLVNSDAMWARADPLDTNIDNLQLAYYVSTFPASIPSGVWADTFATWGDATIEWGEPLAEVAINVDPNLIYQGNRALHFRRAAGAGNAGVISTQSTGFVSGGLARLTCTFLKSLANTNQITLTLRRISDGVFIHTETFTPVAGYWFTHQSAFFEIPTSTDQLYEIEFLATGDDTDELYLSDLHTDIAPIRYFVQLGDSGSFLFDVTPLRYGDSCQVSCTDAVNQFSLTLGIFSSDAWAFGAQLTPAYLR